MIAPGVISIFSDVFGPGRGKREKRRERGERERGF